MEILKNSLMMFVTVATYVSFIPQIIKLYKTKSSEDISTVSWIIWTLSALAYLIFSLIEGGFGLILSSVSEFILTLILLLMNIKYKDR